MHGDKENASQVDSKSRFRVSLEIELAVLTEQRENYHTEVLLLDLCSKHFMKKLPI